MERIFRLVNDFNFNNFRKSLPIKTEGDKQSSYLEYSSNYFEYYFDYLILSKKKNRKINNNGFKNSKYFCSNFFFDKN